MSGAISDQLNGMKLRIHKPFGEIEIEADDAKSLIEQASFWSELPGDCPVCGADVYPHYRVTPEQGFKYYELYCSGDPVHRNQLGQYKTGGLYYKTDQWEQRPATGHDDRDEAAASATPEPAAEPTAEEKAAADRLATAEKAFKSIGVIVPAQKPDETMTQYLDRLTRIYTDKKKRKGTA